MYLITIAQCILNVKLHQCYEFTSLITAEKKTQQEIPLTLHKLIYKKLLHWVHKKRKQEP